MECRTRSTQNFDLGAHSGSVLGLVATAWSPMVIAVLAPQGKLGELQPAVRKVTQQELVGVVTVAGNEGFPQLPGQMSTPDLSYLKHGENGILGLGTKFAEFGESPKQAQVPIYPVRELNCRKIVPTAGTLRAATLGHVSTSLKVLARPRGVSAPPGPSVVDRQLSRGCCQSSTVESERDTSPRGRS